MSTLSYAQPPAFAVNPSQRRGSNEYGYQTSSPNSIVPVYAQGANGYTNYQGATYAAPAAQPMAMQYAHAPSNYNAHPPQVQQQQSRAQQMSQQQPFDYSTAIMNEKSQYDTKNSGTTTLSPSSSFDQEEKKKKNKQTKRRSWFGNSNKTEADRDSGYQISGGDSNKPSPGIIDEQKNKQTKRRNWFGNSNKDGKANGNQISGGESNRTSRGIADQQMIVAEQQQAQSSHGTYNNDNQAAASSSMPTEVHPKKLEMKADRKAKMAGAATTGAIVGAVLTGPAWPVGAMAGAVVGSSVAKVTSRAGERRQQRKWEQNNFNEYIAKGQAGVQSENVSFA